MSERKRMRPKEPCAGGSSRTSCRSVPLPRRRDERIPLDELATEALKHTAWLIARSGYSLEEAAETFRSLCAGIPRHIGRNSKRLSVVDLGQVITLWHTTPEYLDKRGRPIPVPLTGPAPSLEALAHEVDGRLMVGEVLDYLNAAKALKRRGNLLVPRTWEITVPAKTAYQSALHLKAVTGLLRTIDHNAQSGQQWFQYVAEGFVPERAVRASARDFRPTGMEMLKYADDFILRRSREQKGRRCQLSVGVYVYRSPAVGGQGRASARVAGSRARSLPSRSAAKV